MEFNKYLKIRPLGHEENKDIFNDLDDIITIEEKIDGSNFRFYITQDNKVIIGSRTQQLTSNEGEDTNMNKMFVRCSNFVRDKLNNKDLSKYKNMIFYGENCVKHTLSYNWETIPPFLGFDISVDGKYLNNKLKREIFDELELPIVPLLYEDTLINIFNKSDIKSKDEIIKLVPISKYPPLEKPQQLAEGIVIKNYDKQLFAKVVRDEFKERNAEAFGGTPKYNKDGYSDNDKIVFKYCTNARIDKCIFKLIDEGHKLEMPLMKYLPNKVYDDIMEEEIQEIINSRWVVDFGNLKRLVTKRCGSVLKQVIVNNGLNGVIEDGN